jgi:hypothetical protein
MVFIRGPIFPCGLDKFLNKDKEINTLFLPRQQNAIHFQPRNMTDVVCNSSNVAGKISPEAE